MNKRVRFLFCAVLTLFLASCAAIDLPVDLKDFNADAPYGVLVIGNAYDTGGVAMSTGYQVNFRSQNRQPWPSGGPSDVRRGAFVIDRDVEDLEAAFSANFTGIEAYREDFSAVSYAVFKLLPADYYLFQASQAGRGLGTPHITCFQSPVPGFTIEAGEMIYVGNVILEPGDERWFFNVKAVTRDDDGARAAIVANGGDPATLQWRAFRQIEIDSEKCRVY